MQKYAKKLQKQKYVTGFDTTNKWIKFIESTQKSKSKYIERRKKTK